MNKGLLTLDDIIRRYYEEKEKMKIIKRESKLFHKSKGTNWRKVKRRDPEKS